MCRVGASYAGLFGTFYKGVASLVGGVSALERAVAQMKKKSRIKSEKDWERNNSP